MQIQEIENLSFADLKSRRDELIAAAAELPADELAKRFVRARIDAKLRDEKLAEQAATLESLNSGNAALQRELEESRKTAATFKRQVDDLASELHSVKEHHEAIKQESFVTLEKHRDEFAATTEKLATALDDQTQRCERLKAQATRNQHALTSAAKLLNDAIAAQQVDNADEAQ